MALEHKNRMSRMMTDQELFLEKLMASRRTVYEVCSFFKYCNFLLEICFVFYLCWITIRPHKTYCSNELFQSLLCDLPLQFFPYFLLFLKKGKTEEFPRQAR